MAVSRRQFNSLLYYAAAASGFGGLVPTARAADPYPVRPVNVVISFAAGGMTDTVGRLVANELTKDLKQTFVVENRPGAAGQLGTEYVARKPADGYNLLVSATGHVIGPAVQKVAYDPVSDFVPIAILARAPNLLLVHKSVPATNLQEFLVWAKAQKDVPYGTAGAGGSTHLAGELFRTLSGVPMVHVPYKGAAPAVNDLIAGHIKVAIQDSMSATAAIAGGEVRPLASATKEHSAQFPNLPTLDESGFPGFDLYTWLGFYAPKGTPSEIVAVLNKEANEAIHTPATVELLRSLNCEPGPVLDPAGAAKFVAQEVEKWRDVVKTSGVKVE
ncbi:Bug family tripartite tricarboxylate transporter substrate binding protein [Tardiphaga sp. 1201_B9_N1_1]|uniref:Bug family tripartite tricarboxylate transporter substrate binding protein n=1 Tax=unclassified Tardiphaga TaxID=2631404 RepID=UPI003F1F7F02